MINIENSFFSSLKKLEKWFQSQQRILPWRNLPTSYRVWISEIMLQQTQVITVIPYFEKFIQRFPTVEDLVQAEEQEVLFYWSGLGYYSRARNIYRTAKKIIELGRFPLTRNEWLEMPGVGPYTAGAILSIANNQPEAILDGNVERVISRIRRLSRNKGDAYFKARLWKLSKFFVEYSYRKKILPSILNQALMELGATICTPKNPQCQRCPVISICQAQRFGEVSHYPPKKKPKESILIEESVHCVLDSHGKVLIQERSHGKWRAGLWDLLEEIPFEMKNKIQWIGSVHSKHIVTRHKILRKTEVWHYSADSSQWKVSEKNLTSGQWVLSENPNVPVGSAFKKTLKMVHSAFPFHTNFEASQQSLKLGQVSLN